MKKLIVGLLSIMAVVILFTVGLVVFMNGEDEYNATNFYSKVPSVVYDEILDSPEDAIYYYYQESCHFCNNVKEQVANFAQQLTTIDGIDFKVVDMVVAENQNAWYDWASHEANYGAGTAATLNPNYKDEASEMNEVDDVKITGTPGMIYVQDGEIKDYQIGEEIFTTMEMISDKYDLNIIFDRDAYNPK